jgi:four helix bundle protein
LNIEPGEIRLATIRRFEDILAWQKARELTRCVYRISAGGEFARDFGLRDQIRRAAVSIMSNIAEGYERNGNQEFRQFLSIAKGSTGEVKSQLYIAVDAGFIDQSTFKSLYALADETGRLISGLAQYLAASDMRGAKYAPSTDNDQAFRNAESDAPCQQHETPNSGC